MCFIETVDGDLNCLINFVCFLVFLWFFYWRILNVCDRHRYKTPPRLLNVMTPRGHDKLASGPRGPAPEAPLPPQAPGRHRVVILWVDIHDYTQRQIFTSILQKQRKKNPTLSVSLSCDLISHSSSFSPLQFSPYSFPYSFKMSVNQGERKRALLAPLSQHTVFCQKREAFSPALFTLSSPPDIRSVFRGSFWLPSASLYITITNARTSPARPDGTQRCGTPQSPALPCCSLQATSSLSGASSRFSAMWCGFSHLK